jgi:hypothetical protein
MAPEQGGTLPRKDACSLVNVSTIDSWDAFIVSLRIIWTNFCVGYLSRQSGLALGEERWRHDCLSANGLHLPSRDVEHGAREGVLPSV